jgi:hypothetical protein
MSNLEKNAMSTFADALSNGKDATVFALLDKNPCNLV